MGRIDDEKLNACVNKLYRAWISVFNDTDNENYIDYNDTDGYTLYTALAMASALVTSKCFKSPELSMMDYHYNMIKMIVNREIALAQEQAAKQFQEQAAKQLQQHDKANGQE